MNSDIEEAAQGIVNPRPVPIGFGKTLCRFADNEEEALDSPWWIFGDTLDSLARHIAHDRNSERMGLKFMARTMLAVRGEWSSMSFLVIVSTTCALDAYAGRGQRIQDELPNGISWTFTPPKELAQLYIPGLKPIRKKGKIIAPGPERSKIHRVSVDHVPPSNISFWDERSKRKK